MCVVTFGVLCITSLNLINVTLLNLNRSFNLDKCCKMEGSTFNLYKRINFSDKTCIKQLCNLPVSQNDKYA